MGRQHIDHREISEFAAARVNLPKEWADEYRAQARRLRERLEVYLREHPDFSLKKMMLSGSLAKGTALRSLNDIDVACYISGADTPKAIPELLEYIAKRLRSAFPNFNADQVITRTYSVTVSFRGTGLDVDVVPILYDGDVNWYGNLVSQDDGSLLATCVPRHIEFIRSRKAKEPKDFAQVLRLLKFWAARLKREDQNFRFKSFMIELILSHVVDRGATCSDYPEALQNFFTYIAKTGLREQISFDDYYEKAKISPSIDPINIIDPVNPNNNVANRYISSNADAIVEAALDAGDAIDAALSAPTKKDTLYHWRRVFGPSFEGG
jgi:tRNA nucleotidyltransferase (CCA-adding enzyme)